MPDTAVMSAGPKIGVDAPDKGKIDSVAAKVEAEQDAFLDKMFGGEAESKPEKAAKKDVSGDTRDEHGRFSKKEESKAAKPEAKSEQKAESDSTPEGVNAEDYRKALKALQFDGVSQKALSALDPHELVEWGLKRAKNHADIDRLKSDLSEAKKARTEPASKISEAKAEPESDWSKVVEPAAKVFNELLGTNDVEAPLKDFAKQIADSTRKALESEMRAQREELDRMQKGFQAQQQEAARERLSEKYGLDKTDRWLKVTERRASDQNEYVNEQEAIEAACRHEFADEIIESYKAKLKEEHKSRSNGQSTTENRKTPPQAKTKEAHEDQLLDAIFDGNQEEVRRLSMRSTYRGFNELASEE